MGIDIHIEWRNKKLFIDRYWYRYLDSLTETEKVVVSARVMSLDIRWRRILHEYFHVLRE